MSKFFKSFLIPKDIIWEHEIDIKSMSNKELIELLNTDCCSRNTGHAIVTLILERIVNEKQ